MKKEERKRRGERGPDCSLRHLGPSGTTSVRAEKNTNKQPGGEHSSGVQVYTNDETTGPQALLPQRPPSLSAGNLATCSTLPSTFPSTFWNGV